MKWSETTSCFNKRPSAAVIVRRKGQASRRTNYPDYLVHYGIKGQQWGIRRYQNEDGTLTEEGKLRYNEGTPESETWNKKEAKYLTDRELQRRNNRLNQERQYREALTSDAERQAQQVRNDVIKKVIAGTALSLAAVAMRGHWKQAAGFVSKYGKRAIGKVKTFLGTRKGAIIGRNIGRYTKPTGPNMLGNGSEGIKKATNYGILRNNSVRHNPRMYRYGTVKSGTPRLGKSLPNYWSDPYKWK